MRLRYERRRRRGDAGLGHGDWLGCVGRAGAGAPSSSCTEPAAPLVLFHQQQLAAAAPLMPLGSGCGSREPRPPPQQLDFGLLLVWLDAA
jgi:hypothetical protein